MLGTFILDSEMERLYLDTASKADLLSVPVLGQDTLFIVSSPPVLGKLTKCWENQARMMGIIFAYMAEYIQQKLQLYWRGTDKVGGRYMRQKWALPTYSSNVPPFSI